MVENVPHSVTVCPVCKKGRLLPDKNAYTDPETGTRFRTRQCEACKEITHTRQHAEEICSPTTPTFSAYAAKFLELS